MNTVVEDIVAASQLNALTCPVCHLRPVRTGNKTCGHVDCRYVARKSVRYSGPCPMCNVTFLRASTNTSEICQECAPRHHELGWKHHYALIHGMRWSTYREMYYRQRGMCALCDADGTLILDHCHHTGVVRGLVCRFCNLKLTAVDDGDWMTRAIAYRDATHLHLGANRTCKFCGCQLMPTVSRTFYMTCRSAECERLRQQLWTSTMRDCELCGTMYMIRGPRQRYCEACNPEHGELGWRLRYAQSYGINFAAYKSVYERQSGRCALCFGTPCVVDHDHKTFALRGLLCDGCNAMMDAVDDRAWLHRALAYAGRN
jgi:hypothetical protein